MTDLRDRRSKLPGLSTRAANGILEWHPDLDSKEKVAEALKSGRLHYKGVPNFGKAMYEEARRWAGVAD